MAADLGQSLLEWQRALAYLVNDLGFAGTSASKHRTGYRLRYERVAVGVQVAYEVRDSATAGVCRLDSVRGWPPTPGEIGPRTPIDWANLHDLEAVAGRPQTPTIWTIPTEPTIAAYAASLRAEHELLQGDFTPLEAAAALVRARARQAAEAKWGAHEAARRWGDPE